MTHLEVLKLALKRLQLRYATADLEAIAELNKVIEQIEHSDQTQQWAVYCGICKKQWTVPHQHPGKSVCAACETSYGSGETK